MLYSNPGNIDACSFLFLRPLCATTLSKRSGHDSTRLFGHHKPISGEAIFEVREGLRNSRRGACGCAVGGVGWDRVPVGAAQLWVRRVSTPRDSLSDRVLHGSALRHGACRRVRESTLGGACEPLTPGLGGLGRSKCITSSKLLQSLKTHHPAPHSALKQESFRPRQKLWARPQTIRKE